VLAFEICRDFGETPEDGLSPFGDELIVVAVEVAQQPNQKLKARMRLARFNAKRRGDVGELGGHLGLVHIDADADDGVMDAVGLGVHFGEDAGKFSAAEKQVVGPSDVEVMDSVLFWIRATDFFGARVASSEAGDESEKRRVGGRDLRAQEHGAMYAGGFFGKPFASGAAAPGRLFFGENDGAVGFAGFAELHGHGVGGVDFEEMVDAAREGCARELVAEKLRREDVGNALDVVAGGGVSFDADAESAQLFDPAPDLLAGDANLLGDFCAADDDGGIFGEEGEQGVDAAVGGAGKSSHARGGHWEQGSILEAGGEDKESGDEWRVASDRQTEASTSELKSDVFVSIRIL